MTDGGQTGVYTINVTRTDFPGAPRNLRATAVDVGNQVTLSWTAPADDGGRDHHRIRATRYYSVCGRGTAELHA